VRKRRKYFKGELKHIWEVRGGCSWVFAYVWDMFFCCFWKNNVKTYIWEKSGFFKKCLRAGEPKSGKTFNMPKDKLEQSYKVKC
jgi:hypothetical protein